MVIWGSQGTPYLFYFIRECSSYCLMSENHCFKYFVHSAYVFLRVYFPSHIRICSKLFYPKNSQMDHCIHSPIYNLDILDVLCAGNNRPSRSRLCEMSALCCEATWVCGRQTLMILGLWSACLLSWEDECLVMGNQRRKGLIVMGMGEDQWRVGKEYFTGGDWTGAQHHSLCPEKNKLLAYELLLCWNSQWT